MIKNRSYAFGKLFAVSNVLGERVLEGNKVTLASKYMSRFSKNPAKAWEKIHTELMERSHKFKKEENDLLEMFGQIIDEIGESDFNNNELDYKYIKGYHDQQHELRALR